MYDTASSAVIIKKAYYDKYDAKLIFKIPVYTSIPEQIVTKPTANNYKNNYYLTSLSAIGLTDNFSMYRQSYSLSVSGNTAVYAKPLSGATIVSQSVNTLAAGNNRVDIKVRAETGYINTYTLNVYASIPCTLTVYASAGGDTNGDGVIDAVDLANIQKHIVRKIILSGDGFSAGDTNGDGVINAVDLANIQKYIVSAK